MPSSRMPALLVADPSGKVLEHPRLLATVRSGDEVLLPPEPGTQLPEGGRLVHLPGRRPVGVGPETGELVLVSEVQVGRRSFGSPHEQATRAPRAVRACPSPSIEPSASGSGLMWQAKATWSASRRISTASFSRATPRPNVSSAIPPTSSSAAPCGF